MKLNNAAITFRFTRDGLLITLHDRDAIDNFAEITLTVEQMGLAFSNMGYVPCGIELHNMDRVGKKHEHSTLEFPVIGLNYEQRRDNDLLYNLALEHCPEGWTPDRYGFRSQNTFFQKDGVDYCRVIIRRWVNV